MGSKWTRGVPGNYMERTDGGHGRKNFMLNRERDSGGEKVQIWNRLDPAAERSPAGGALISHQARNYIQERTKGVDDSLTASLSMLILLNHRQG